MIVFSSIVPHSPLLLPRLEKEEDCAATLSALGAMEKSLYAAKPDVLLFISPHPSVTAATFLVNISPQYSVDLSSFGDYHSYPEFDGDVRLASDMKTSCHRSDFELASISQTQLDYGTSIPLLLLGEHLRDSKVLPLHSSTLAAARHLEFGKFLSPVLHETNARIAIIASVDMHKDAQARADALLIEKIQAADLEAIASLPPENFLESSSCAQKPLSLLAGLLEGLDFKVGALSHEVAGKTGLLTCELDLA